MRILIDENEDFDVADRATTALDAVVLVSDHLRREGRGILRLELDGVTVLPDGLRDELSHRELNEEGTLRVRTERIAALVEDAFRELDRVAPELPDLCRGLARLFQGGQAEQAYEPFQQLAVIWETIKNRETEIAGALGIDLSSLCIGDLTFEQLHRDLNQYLAESVDALERGDTVLLGDLLEYELAPRAEDEERILESLRSRFAEPPAQ